MTSGITKHRTVPYGPDRSSRGPPEAASARNSRLSCLLDVTAWFQVDSHRDVHHDAPLRLSVPRPSAERHKRLWVFLTRPARRCVFSSCFLGVKVTRDDSDIDDRTHGYQAREFMTFYVGNPLHYSANSCQVRKAVEKLSYHWYPKHRRSRCYRQDIRR